MHKFFSFILSLLLIFSSCAFLDQVPVKLPENAKSHNLPDEMKGSNPGLLTDVKIGKMEANVTIRTESGTVFSGGSTFTPKKFANGWINPGNGFTKKWKESGGEKVTISRPGKPDMYGILEFSKVYSECSDLPATRSYYVRIPESYFTAAQGGNISSIYEYYACKPTEDSKKENYTTWALWISDVPF